MAGPALTSFAAVVLAGGTARRLDGADKAAVELDGRTLLSRALDAVAEADEVVVVGDPVVTAREVAFTRESPRYGGPVAALLAGRDALRAPGDLVAVLACDMPHLSPATLTRIRAAVAGHDGAVLTGPDGRRQLALVVRTDRLEAVRPEEGAAHGMALHRLLSRLDLAEVPAAGQEHRDVDTWADLRDLTGPPTGGLHTSGDGGSLEP